MIMLRRLAGAWSDYDGRFIEIGEIEFFGQGEFLGEDFAKEMVAQIFGKPGSVGQSGTVDIAPLIRTFELRIALGSQVNFGVITINDFKFSGEGLITARFAKHLGKGGNSSR